MELTNVEILSTGMYEGRQISTQDLDNAVLAFGSLVDEFYVPLKSGDRVLGRLTKLWRSGHSLRANITGIAREIFDALKRADSYSRRVGFYRDAVLDSGESHSLVLKSVDLVGVVLPPEPPTLPSIFGRVQGGERLCFRVPFAVPAAPNNSVADTRRRVFKDAIHAVHLVECSGDERQAQRMTKAAMRRYDEVND